jgi:integrase
VKDHIIPVNPCGVCDPPKKAHFEATIIKPSDMIDFLSLFKGSMIEDVVLIALYTGMRRSEILALKWTDIDMQNEAIKVSSSLRAQNGGFIHAPTKNKQSRTIPLSPGLKGLLLLIIDKQNEDKKVLGKCYDDRGYIIARQDGRPLRPDYVTTTFIKERGEKYKNVRFHDLRHTAATLMLMNNTDLKNVSAILGHSSIKITGDIYINSVEEMKRDAVIGLDKMIRPNLTILKTDVK